MNVEQKLSCSLDDLIKKDGRRSNGSNKRPRGGRNQSVVGNGLRASSTGASQRGSGRVNRRGRGGRVDVVRGKGGRPLPADVVMRDVNNTNRGNKQQQGRKSFVQQQQKGVRSNLRGTKLIGGLSVTRRGLIGKSQQNLRFNGLPGISARGGRMTRATAYRANTSLGRRQAGFLSNVTIPSMRRQRGGAAGANGFMRGGMRPTASWGSAIRKRPMQSGNRTFDTQQRNFRPQGFQMRQRFGQSNSYGGSYASPRRPPQASSASGVAASSSASSGSAGLLNNSLVKQIKIVAELDQVPPPLLSQRADADRRVGRLVDNQTSVNNRSYGGQQRRRNLTLSDRFS